MSLFLICILMILAGGLFSLVLAKQAGSVKLMTVMVLAAGCLLGLINAVSMLFQPGTQTFSAGQLNAFPLSFAVDGVSAFFLAVIFGICFLAAIYSYHYMDHDRKPVKTGVNYFFFSLLIASMALVVTASDILSFMLTWEMMSLSSFFLVIYNHQAAENRKAGYLYFVFSHVGAMFIFAAFGLIYGYTGSLAFGSMAQVPETVKMVIFFFCLVGFGSKAGIFPFHVWLPFAHPAAPSHISAVMSGVMIKTGVYGIIRVYLLLELYSPVFGMVLIIAGAVSGILGIAYALAQHDLKRLLAYSSVENIGIIFIGLGIGMMGIASHHPVMAALGFAGAFWHILNHAIFKSLLFMGAGMILHKTGTRSIDALGGLLKQMKVTGVTFIIGAVAISGLPPFNGFAGEFLIYLAGFSSAGLDSAALIMSILAVISLAVIGGLALACFTKVVGVVFQGEPRTRAAQKADEKGGAAMLVSMSVLAGACVLIGICPWLAVFLPVQAVQALGLGLELSAVEPVFTAAGNLGIAAAGFAAVFVLVILLRRMLYRDKPISASSTWGCGFTQPTVKMQYTGSSYASFILEFFGAAAPLSEDHPPIKGRFPLKTHYKSHISDVADLYMNKVVVNPVLFVFDKLRWIQHGDIHLYIGYILLAIVLLLFFI